MDFDVLFSWYMITEKGLLDCTNLLSPNGYKVRCLNTSKMNIEKENISLAFGLKIEVKKDIAS